MRKKYRQIKEEELRCLGHSDHFEQDWDLFIDLKFKVLQKYKLQKQSLLSLPLTNIDNSKKTFPYLETPLSYKYQRQGVYYDNKSIEFIYPQIASTTTSSIFFTSNGQAANYVVFKVLSSRFPTLEPKSQTDLIYYETQEILDSNTNKEPKNSQINLIDSSFVQNIEDYESEKLCIIDTTCIALEDKGIFDKINNIAKKQTVILTRSHLKMDSFGAEYGLLGSIVVLNEEKEPITPKLSSNRLSQDIFSICSITGSNASIDQIYPFFQDNRIMKLNSNRILRIKNNCSLMQDIFKRVMKEDKRFRLKTYHHQLFFKIYCIDENKKIPFLFLKICKALNLPAKVCDSFGFDFIALSPFKNGSKSEYTHIIRLCPPDLTDEYIEELKILSDKLSEEILRAT